jgi:AraC-like DNA-binding protein
VGTARICRVVRGVSQLSFFPTEYASMQSESATIHVLHSDPVVTAFESSLRFSYRVHSVPNWKALELAVRTSPNCIAIVDPFFGTTALDEQPSRELRELVAVYGSTPFVVAYHIDPMRPQQTRQVAELGIAEIVDLGGSLDPPSLLQLLESVRGYRMRKVLASAVPRFVSARALVLLTAVGETVAAGGLAPQLAGRLGVTERTLLRWCQKLDLGQPRRLLAWMRLFLAADMLSEGDRSVAAVAAACGYSSDPSLRNALKHIGGTTPGEVKRLGSGRSLAERFAGELGARRSRRGGVRAREHYLN